MRKLTAAVLCLCSLPLMACGLSFSSGPAGADASLNSDPVDFERTRRDHPDRDHFHRGRDGFIVPAEVEGRVEVPPFGELQMERHDIADSRVHVPDRRRSLPEAGLDAGAESSIGLFPVSRSSVILDPDLEQDRIPELNPVPDREPVRVLATRTSGAGERTRWHTDAELTHGLTAMSIRPPQGPPEYRLRSFTEAGITAEEPLVLVFLRAEGLEVSEFDVFHDGLTAIADNRGELPALTLLPEQAGEEKEYSGELVSVVLEAR